MFDVVHFAAEASNVNGGKMDGTVGHGRMWETEEERRGRCLFKGEVNFVAGVGNFGFHAEDAEGGVFDGGLDFGFLSWEKVE